MGDMTVDELKDKKLWFLWSAKPGRNGKVTKVPFAANGGATGTDDAHKGTWVSFDDAESARNQFQASGLGLKIPKGFFLLDIDHKDISDPFGRKKCDFMARPDLAEKDILNPSKAIEYFVLSRRKFYDLLNNTDGEDFLAYYGERKLILRVAFERYLRNHPELRRRV
mgnify:FL=1